MKKCPVCGVEHSDIVHVCSICGSSLDEAPSVEPSVEPSPAPEQPEPQQPAPGAETGSAPVNTELYAEDVQKTISSIVQSTVEAEKKQAEEAESAAAEVDSPFVIDETKEKKENVPGAQPPPPPQSRRPRGRQRKKAAQRAQDMDTTVVAADSAKRVYQATQNAIKARNAQETGAKTPQTPPPSRMAPKDAKAAEKKNGDVKWSERKHTREKTKSSRRIVVAVCAFLALLIVAILVAFGKMIFSGNTGTPADSKDNTAQQQEETLPDETPQEQTPAPTEETEIVTEEPAQTGEDAEQGDAEEINAEDPDLAAENQQTQQGGNAETGNDETANNAEAQNGEAQNAASQGGDAEGQNTDNRQEAQQQPEAAPAQLPAISDADETVYATSDVRVRDYPGTQGSNVINVLTAGQSVKRTGTTSTGWSRVEIGGKTGYVSSNYLSTSKVTASDNSGSNKSSDGTVSVTKGGVNLRDVPNGNILATLNKGDKVTPTGKTQGSWTQVSYNGSTGYVYTSYLSSASGSSDKNVTQQESSDTVYAVSGVNVRSEPSSSGKVLTTLSKGQKVSRTGTTSNGWSKVKVGDVTGYVYSDYLSSSKDGGKKSTDSTSGSGSKTNSGYILPNSDSHIYTDSELSKLSKSQLRLARNEIYARHGRKFNDKSLQDYFNSCSWYKGTVDAATFDANVLSYLNDYEVANLSAIASAEN